MATYTIDKFKYDGDTYQLQDNVSGYSIARTFWCVCESAANLQIKTATCSDPDFALVAGGLYVVSFKNGNTNAVSPKLNINGTGDKQFVLYDLGVAPKVPYAYVATFVYDGTYYRMVSNNAYTWTGNKVSLTSMNDATYGGASMHKLVTDTVTTGKPDWNGHIFQLGWPNMAWDAQIFIPYLEAGDSANASHKTPQWRACANDDASGWSQWYKVYTEAYPPPAATSLALGLVKPDGTTTSVDANGAISATVAPKTYFGRCTTAESTADKVVTCPEFTALEVGATITVQFTLANTAVANVTLNVNNTGAVYVATTGRRGNITAWANTYQNITFVYGYANPVNPDSANMRWHVISAAGMLMSGGDTVTNLNTETPLGGMTQFLSGTTTATGAPTYPSHILHLGSLNTHQEGQIAIPLLDTNDTGNSSHKTLEWRASAHGVNDWSQWYKVYTEAYPPPAATASTLGMVKVGSGLSVAADGTISLNVQSANGVSF